MGLFLEAYENLVKDAAVPRSAKFMDQEDKDGYQLWRVVVLSTKVDNYLVESRKQGHNMKRFVYNYDKYRQEQEIKVKLEHKIETLKVISIPINPHRPRYPAEATTHSVSYLSPSCT